MQTLICGSICVQTLICGTVGLAECMYIYMYTCIVNQTFFDFEKGMANMHKKQRRQGRDGLVMMSR